MDEPVDSVELSEDLPSVAVAVSLQHFHRPVTRLSSLEQISHSQVRKFRGVKFDDLLEAIILYLVSGHRPRGNRELEFVVKLSAAQPSEPQFLVQHKQKEPAEAHIFYFCVHVYSPASCLYRIAAQRIVGKPSLLKLLLYSPVCRIM